MSRAHLCHHPHCTVPEGVNLMMIDLSTIHLTAGSHRSREAGMCAMEAAAYIAGEPHSDHPECVCPTIAAYMRAWNDDLPSDEERDRLLKPLLFRVIGTRSTDEVAERRAYMALNWMVGEWLPAWLRSGGLDEHADRCAGVEWISDAETAERAGRVVREARGAASAARAAVRDARAAVRDVRDAAWAAGAAARDAAWAAAWAAGDAWDKLAPTVAALQESATTLVIRMCEAKE